MGDPPSRPPDPDLGSADIEITLTVEAAHLRFRAPPHSDVRLSGTPGRKSETSSSRTNLADPVSQGVDYRDVRVTYTLANRLKA